ncbi:hypothetical protein [Vibrio phage vB_ValP_FGH]|nr:hypothetical protein [Vibrio phage vB_ValP_FGH]
MKAKKVKFKCECCKVNVSRPKERLIQEHSRKYCSEKCLMKWRLANG